MATDPPVTRAVVHLERSQVPDARTVAAAHDVEVEELSPSGFEPVTTVVLVLMGAMTSVATVSRLLEQRKGGQVIDLRVGASRQLYRTPDLLYGMIVVYTSDGQVRVEVKEPDSMFGKIADVLPGMLSTGGRKGEVSRLVDNAFGGDVQVEPGADPDPDEG